jgi:glycosyltransferase involved in cell wall biosynthesis
MAKKKQKNRKTKNTKTNVPSTRIKSMANEGDLPTISLCMIVKNEEDHLQRCLDSIKDVVDEIIIVDTGSSDRTVEIAESYGAKVYHHPWENDFSKHRNQSISYASGDWILEMDADEEFFFEDAPKIKSILKETNADFLYLQCYDLEKTGKVHGVFNKVQLFRNGLGMQYIKRVHNQLQTVGRGDYTKLRFTHFGYDLSPEKMDAKHKRTTTLLQEEIQKDPENPYSHSQLAASYSMHREFEKAIEEGELALKLMRQKGITNTFFVTSYYTVSQGYFVSGDLDRAEKVCHEALDFFEMDLNSYHFLAAIYFKKRDLNRCKKMSHKYLEVWEMFEEHPEKMQGIYFNSYTKRHEIYYGLACVHFLEKSYEKAEEYFEKAFDEEGRPLMMARNISLFYLEQKMDKPALKWLDIAYNAGYRDAELLEKFKDYYVQKGLPVVSTKMKTLLDAYPSWGAIWTILGDIQIKEKDISEAVKSYERSITLDHSQSSTYKKLSLAYEELGDTESAIVSCLKYSKLFRDDKSIYLRLAQLYLEQQYPEKAMAYLEEAADDCLSELDKNEKGLLGIGACWLTGDVENLITSLEQVMTSLGMDTNVTIDSADGLGRLLYDISEQFCVKKQWHLAEMAFRTASQIAPEILDANRFTELLASARG